MFAVSFSVLTFAAVLSFVAGIICLFFALSGIYISYYSSKSIKYSYY